MSSATDAQNGTKAGLPQSPAILHALMAVLAIGLGIAAYMVRHKLLLETGLIENSSCNINTTINCDAVNTSQYSSLMGLPIALYAIPTYAVMAFLAWLGVQGVGSSDEAIRERGRYAVAAVAAIGILTVLHAMYMAYLSSAVLHTYCLFCMSLYVVNIVSTVLAIKAGPGNVGAAFSGAFEALTTFKPPVPQAVAVLLGVAFVSYVGHDQLKRSYDAEAVATVAAKMGGTAPVAVGSAQQQGGVAPAEVAQEAPPSGKDCGDGPQYDPAAARIAGQQTKEDGWTEVHYPIDEDCEFFYGNPKAKVTFVKVADFQCPYCRYLAMTLDPIMKEYKDRVRFVMRHFPMNGRCNPRMSGYDKHPNACEASWAAHCAGLQGKFWEMHDHLYANQQALDEYNLDKHAQTLGLDMTKFRLCMKDPKTDAHIKKDIQIAYKGGIYGTPKAYINGRLVTGSGSKAIFKYHLDLALKEAESGQQVAAGGAAQQAAPKGDGTSMVEGKTASKSFFIDPFEASIGKDGKAYSKPGAKPARVSWQDAKDACEKAGKRLCSEEEWVSVCTGEPAVDNNNNGQFADDDVEGRMYPYGAFYKANACMDQGDKYQGNPVPTGSMEQCRTPSGVFDLAGNISEWVGATKETATLLGGHTASGEGARCNDRAFQPGIGRRNHTTGFRCCADSNVRSSAVDVAALQPVVETMKGQQVPDFEAKDSEGNTIRSRDFKGKVTLLNFFASWCGPCKKEFPFLVQYAKTYKAKGFQIVGVGVDNESTASYDFAKEFGANFPIIGDPDSILMGKLMVYSMPATFLIDKTGKILYTHTGFKPEEDEGALRAQIERLL
ncbi:MAG: thioredoxin domain-containing protein [Deltaproteobacteria bacterium]|nr:thioredoxin domain-containing protein [Deltaproteobacteria bacterium]